FARAQRRAIVRAPWHAGQVLAALGAHADRALIDACAADLARAPWAPWTVIGARASGAADLAARAEPALAASLRPDAPHRGAADVTTVPETALTAVAIEALNASRSAAARRAVARGRDFLLRWQLLGDRFSASYVPAARGAFPLSPARDLLRADVT